MKKLCTLIALTLWIAPWSVYAATQTAASCSYADVNTAYTAANNSDTIAIPACAETDWGTDHIHISKTGLIIQGAGIGNTIIKATNQVFVPEAESANNIRITGIEFHGCGQCIYFNYSGEEGTKDLRVDTCKFTGSFGTAIQVMGHARGVIDHVQYIDGTPDTTANLIYGSNNLTDTFPFTLGTNDAVFFEDNTIAPSAGKGYNHFIASNSGSKYVVRENTFTYVTSYWDIIDAHGYCEIQGRGSFTWEIYNNTFDLHADLNRVMRFRGGQGVVWGNTITPTSDWAIVLTDIRTCDPPCVEQQNGITDVVNNSYFWNNTNGGAALTPTNDCGAAIVLNTNYFNSEMPGYTAYQYPHPLQNAGETLYTVTPSVASGSGSLNTLVPASVVSGQNSPTYTATPANGWKVTWSGTGGCTGSGSTCQVTNVTADKTVIATFSEIRLMPW